MMHREDGSPIGGDDVLVTIGPQDFDWPDVSDDLMDCADECAWADAVRESEASPLAPNPVATPAAKLGQRAKSECTGCGGPAPCDCDEAGA